MTFFKTHFRAFTLIDVLIGVTLTSFLVILLFFFIADIMRYTSYISKHQEIRVETFALINTVLPRIIREASAIDYANTNDHQLALFMDKMERKNVMILRQVDEDKDKAQLVLREGETQTILNSQKTFIDTFEIQIAKKPSAQSILQLQYDRAQQPMVKIRIAARHQRPEGMKSRTDFTFFEDPRIAYESSYTLRNYAFSNFRSL